jgi:hypothetical protein
MKQTAVEWLGLYIKGITTLNCDDIIDQAKAMEKEQIIDAHNQSWHDRMNPYKTAEQYYKETYNNNDRNSS